MLFFARFLMRGNWQAPLMAALLFPFPLSSCLGAAVVALMALRKGFYSGLVSGLAAAIAVYFVAAHPVIMMSGLAEIIIVLICSHVLRRTERLDLTLLYLVGLTAGFVVSLQHWGGISLASYEKTLLDAIKEIRVSLPLPDGGMAFRDWILQSIVLGVSLKVLAGLFLGRWWQSELFFPGAFGKAFFGFYFKSIIASVLMMSAFAVYLGSARYVSLSVLFLLPLVVMSVALVHNWMKLKKINRFWLVGFYVLLPFTYLFVAVFAWGNCLKKR